MRRPNHASRFEGIAKTNLQASRASDTETLQSQVNKAAKKRLSLSGLEILHGRLVRFLANGSARAKPDIAHRDRPAIAYVDGRDDFLTSPFLTPASGKIHMAITMNTAVTMTNVENSGRIGDRDQ